MIVILGIAITLYHKREAHRGRVDAVTALIHRALLIPEFRFVHRATTVTRPYMPYKAANLRRENDALRKRVEALSIENEMLREQAQDAETMRQMLKLPDTPPSILRAADVIALKASPQRDNALVLLGNGWSAKQRDVVIGPTGALAGQVIGIDGSLCDVLLITDTQSSVGARVVQNGRPAAAKAVIGICQGARGSLLNLVDLEVDADIKAGDTVQTSGIGTVFPQGIPIGTVIAVKPDPSRSLKTATVQTANDFNSLTKVFLRR